MACMATCMHMVYYYYKHRWRLSRDRRKTRLFLCCVTRWRCAAMATAYCDILSTVYPVHVPAFT